MIAAINNLILPHLAHVPILFNTPGAVCAMLINVYIAKLFQVLLSVLLLSKYDNVQANFRTANTSRKGKDDKEASFSEKMVQRAYNAHLNSWEAFTSFAAAVILALQLVGDSKELLVLANAFVLVRFAYTLIYIAAFNNVLALVRGGAFAIGFSLILQIFAMAAGEHWKNF